MTLCDSHIIPEFQYKPLYDQKHRLNVISADPKVNDRYAQKGFREKLLCPDCEQLFSKWEHYAKGIMFDDGLHFIQGGEHFFHLGGVDYQNFKLYLLSLIWRMGISSLPFFKLVELGPYQEKLRQLLLTADPGPSLHYPCLMTAIHLDGKFLTEWICPPDKIKVGNRTCYRFVMAGIAYTVFVSDKRCEFALENLSVNEQGRFVLWIENVEHVPFLWERLFNSAKAMHARKRKS